MGLLAQRTASSSYSQLVIIFWLTKVSDATFSFVDEPFPFLNSNSCFSIVTSHSRPLGHVSCKSCYHCKINNFQITAAQCINSGSSTAVKYRYTVYINTQEFVATAPREAEIQSLYFIPRLLLLALLLSVEWYKFGNSISDFFAVLPDCSNLTAISDLLRISLTHLASSHWVKKASLPSPISSLKVKCLQIKE